MSNRYASGRASELTGRLIKERIVLSEEAKCLVSLNELRVFRYQSQIFTKDGYKEYQTYGGV
jgi:hypothetical protein